MGEKIDREGKNLSADIPNLIYKNKLYTVQMFMNTCPIQWIPEEWRSRQQFTLEHDHAEQPVSEKRKQKAKK